VFSGRRGIHCWVCDDEAREINNEIRAAITDYCNLPTGNDKGEKLQLNGPLHPMLKRAYKIIDRNFEQIII
jgi:DNA primase small subunit